MNARIENALVLAPHPDDELNIAGQLIPRLVASDVDCHICFSTNGDYSPWEASTRHGEALEAAARLGLGEDQVIFLGYGDGFHGPHIYIEGAGKVVESHAGHVRAYVPDGEPFSQRAGREASPYDRASFISDIKGVLEFLLPDLILCVDYDSHPDHKALSQGFERAMSQVLVENRAYKPIVLKKFAYASSWKGPEDYWDFAPCKIPATVAEEYPFALPNPTYSWEERLRLEPDPSTVTSSLRRNALFKAARAHKTQLAWVEAARICNSDVVCWLRRTDNLLLEGRVAASSGDFSGVDGFSRFEVRDVGLGFSIDQFQQKGWMPEEGDEARWLSIEFPVKRALEEGRITVFPACAAPPGSVSVRIDGCSLAAQRIASTCCYGFVNSSRMCQRFEIILGPCDDFAVEAVELYECSAVKSEFMERLNAVLPGVDDSFPRGARGRTVLFPRIRTWMLHVHAFLSRCLVRIERRLRKSAYMKNVSSDETHARF